MSIFIVFYFQIILLPCGHVSICEDCSDYIKDNCPVCRTAIVSKAPAFITWLELHLNYLLKNFFFCINLVKTPWIIFKGAWIMCLWYNELEIMKCHFNTFRRWLSQISRDLLLYFVDIPCNNDPFWSTIRNAAIFSQKDPCTRPKSSCMGTTDKRMHL